MTTEEDIEWIAGQAEHMQCVAPSDAAFPMLVRGALKRQLPRMVAALRFVDAEVELLGMALACLECQPSVAESLQADCRTALRKLAALRRPQTETP